jgi:hypothetical protein
LIKVAKDKNLSIEDVVVHVCKNGLDRLGWCFFRHFLARWLRIGSVGWWIFR